MAGPPIYDSTKFCYLSPDWLLLGSRSANMESYSQSGDRSQNLTCCLLNFVICLPIGCCLAQITKVCKFGLPISEPVVVIVTLYFFSVHRFHVRGGFVRPAPAPPRLRPHNVSIDGRCRRLLRHRPREARGYSGTDSMKPV